MTQKLNEMEKKAKKREQLRKMKSEQDHLRGAEKYDAEGNRRQQAEYDTEEEDDGYQSCKDEEDADLNERLPSVNDPKLWQVRVKKGMEKHATLALLNKASDFQSRN